MINRFIYKIIVFTVIFFSFSYVMAENIEYVDLGLSVKWANMNVGAESETDYGLYFQWGDTVGYADASHSAWRGSNQTSNFSTLDSQETCLKE